MLVHSDLQFYSRFLILYVQSLKFKSLFILIEVINDFFNPEEFANPIKSLLKYFHLIFDCRNL